MNLLMRENLLKNRKSFTLIEVLVAVSIFAILALTAASTFVNFMGVKRRADLVQYIKNEGDFLMERIKREIRNGTVDYEEYYNQHHIGGGYYATNYGVYGRQFFNAGHCGGIPDNRPVTGLAGYGVRCKNDCGEDYWTSISLPGSCDKIAYESRDANIWEWTGANANALDDSDNTNDDHFQQELYLINAKGRKRTILKPASIMPGPDGKLNTELIMLQLNGTDSNSNGIVDTWFCADEFLTIHNILQNECAAYSATYKSKGVAANPPAMGTGKLQIAMGINPFVSVTPSRLKVTQLKFFISPLEDPRKARAEDLGEVYVTIILSVKPKEEFARAIPGDIPEYTMQTTVTAGAKNFVPTWHGVLQN